MQLTSGPRRIVRVLAARTARVVQQSAPLTAAIGWSIAQYESKPSASTCWTKSRVSDHDEDGSWAPQAMPKRMPRAAWATHGCDAPADSDASGDSVIDAPIGDAYSRDGG